MHKNTTLDTNAIAWNFESVIRCMKNVATTVALIVAMTIASAKFTLVPRST